MITFCGSTLITRSRMSTLIMSSITGTRNVSPESDRVAVTAEPQHQPLLVLGDDARRARQRDERDEQDDDEQDGSDSWVMVTSPGA